MRVISLMLLVAFLVGCKRVSGTTQSTGMMTTPLPEALRLVLTPRRVLKSSGCC